MTIPAWLVVSAAAAIGALGLTHLLFTFRSGRLLPRDAALKARMQAVYPRLSRRTTMWRAWVSFNASHGFGALLFCALYAYLALAAPALLFGAWFLAAAGQSMLLAYLWLGWRYGLTVPTHLILAANVAFAAAAVLARLG